MKERQPVKSLKKQNGNDRNITVGNNKSGKKLNPEIHMESQDHLQKAIEYLRKYQNMDQLKQEIVNQTTHTLKIMMQMMTNPDQKK